MPNTIAQKLKIKDGMKLLTLHAPVDFAHSLQSPGVTIGGKLKQYDQVHWFVSGKAQLEEEVEGVIKMLNGNKVCWIYYRKGTSKIKTDINRDSGWESLQKHKELQFLTLISFNETWSAFGMRLKNEADIKKQATPKEREIFKYLDAAKKVIYLPDDLKEALANEQQASSYFHSLSFTKRKEYVEWIVTAKREETRKQRIAGTIERLLKQWKNPRNM